ncbi:hypothetical protein ACFL4S_01855 [bacterium]
MGEEILDDIAVILKRDYLKKRMKKLELEISKSPEINKEYIKEYETIAKQVKGSR